MLLAASAIVALAATGSGPVAAANEGASSAPGTPVGSPFAGDPHGHQPDVDNRPAQVAPTSAQKQAVTGAASRSAGASAAPTVTWNRFGSVGTMLPGGSSKSIATGLGSDPEKAARSLLDQQRSSLGLSSAAVKDLELVTINKVGTSDVVMLRQTIDGLAAGLDGLVVVAVEKGRATFVSSTLAPVRTAAKRAPASSSITPEKALSVAAEDIGHPATSIAAAPAARGAASSPWDQLTADGLLGEQHVKKVAVPVPGAASRTAFHVVIRADQAEGYSVYVDAADGSIIARESLVDFDTDDPTWSVFTGTPEASQAPPDSRIIWCEEGTAEGCEETVGNPASPLGWDVDPATEATTTTTNGNNAYSGERWIRDGVVTPAPLRSNRNYTYPFTGQWTTEGCNPANYESEQRNDIDAATANLFAMHNRLHDWSYNLGFTETAWNMQRSNFNRGGLGNDPELGYAQSGAQSGLRNNANQGTPPDGISGYSNMYLWQPLAGAFYAPCVDGDYDMSVIGHEYGHAISNRMAGGPNMGLSGLQAGAMGESWSDLVATEYLQEYGYAPLSATATPMGAYVTGNAERGIRNYNYSASPLNYSNLGYDLTGPQVHADGEIWSATQGDIRSAFMERYGSGDAATQRACAEGERAVRNCPGNRQWIQLVFDAWLLMPSGAVSMVDARNAMLAADLLRFGGANQDLLWNGFAGRGLGRGASATSSADTAPIPSFESAYSNNATLQFNPTGEDGRPVVGAKVYVGEYVARSRAIADTDEQTALGSSFTIMPGERTYTVTAPGKAQTQVTLAARPGQSRNLNVRLRDNLASAQAGGRITGEGVDIEALTDGDEGTTATTVAEPSAAQKVFTVDLAGGRQTVRRVQLSALPEPGAAGRFQNLRQFRVLACDARNRITCEQDGDYRVVYTSPADAFPGAAPRPVAPELKMRSFDIPQTAATHLRVEFLENQCTGGEEFAGEQDQDPDNETDCATGYAGASTIAASEFQVMRR